MRCGFTEFKTICILFVACCVALPPLRREVAALLLICGLLCRFTAVKTRSRCKVGVKPTVYPYYPYPLFRMSLRYAVDIRLIGLSSLIALRLRHRFVPLLSISRIRAADLSVGASRRAFDLACNKLVIMHGVNHLNSDAVIRWIGN